MGEKVTEVKQKIGQNEYSEKIPIGAKAENIDLSNGSDLQMEYDSVSAILATINETLKYVTGVEQRYRTLTLSVANWSFDAEKSYYKYVIDDAEISRGILVTGYMDINNQSKLANGFIEAYAGGYTIYSSVKPTEEIEINISTQKVAIREDEDSVIGAINVTGLQWTQY